MAGSTPISGRGLLPGRTNALDILRALEVFIQTAETGSLSAAGRRLGMTSSAVSKQISALEKDARVALLTRTTRGLSLTAAGQNCLTRARAIVGEVSAMRAALQDEGGSVLRGHLRISMPSGFGRKRTWPAIRRLQPSIRSLRSTPSS